MPSCSYLVLTEERSAVVSEPRVQIVLDYGYLEGCAALAINNRIRTMPRKQEYGSKQSVILKM